jgi:hypothetical protein
MLKRINAMITTQSADSETSQVQTQIGIPTKRNLAPLGTPLRIGRRFALLAAVLLASGAIAKAQILSLKIDSSAKMYTWTGSQSFSIMTGRDALWVGLGFGFEGKNSLDNGLPSLTSGALGLGVAASNRLDNENEFHTAGSADLFGNVLTLSLDNQTFIQTFARLGPDVYRDVIYGGIRYSNTTYEVTVAGDGVAHNLPINVATDLSNLDGKSLVFIRFDANGDGLATGFLDAGTISVTPVPEPASVALVSAVGLVGFAVWRRRNQAKRALSQDAAS